AALPLVRLAFAGLERGVREERFQRRQLRAFRREAARSAHELFQVLDARLAALGLVAPVVDEAARLQHLVHLLVQRKRTALGGEPLDERHEAVDGAARLRAERSARRERSRSRLPQRAAVRPDARRQERLLDHPRLRVGAVEDRDLAPRAPARHVLADAVGHELRLVPLVEGGVETDRLATRTGRPELLAEAAGVVPDEPVGGFQDGAGGAVVLLEAEQLRPRVVAAELLEVPGARAPEAVNRVVGDDAASNEVMRALDVEIIDLARVWLSLD